MNKHKKLSLFVIIITMFIGILTIFSAVGDTARLPILITIFATGFGAGVSLMNWIRSEQKQEL